MSLRPKLKALHACEPLLDSFRAGRRRQRAVDFGRKGGPAAPRLIDYVNGIPLSQKELCPALSSVGRAGKVRAGLTSAVNHHDGIRMRHLARNLEFGINLPAHHLPAIYSGIPAAGE